MGLSTPSLKNIVLYLILFLKLTTCSCALVDGLYCGQLNCYDVLKVNRESSEEEIAASYSKLAKSFHPDYYSERKDKLEAKKRFDIIEKAYETLKNKRFRGQYNNMLDQPNEIIINYYYYYRQKYIPQMDLRISIPLMLSILSIMKHINNYYRWLRVINSMALHPATRKQAWDYAESNNMLKDYNKIKKRDKKAMRVEENRIIKQVIMDNADIRGGIHKPTIYDVVWTKILLSPIRICQYVYWYISWVWRFNIKKQEYGMEEKCYLIRRHLRFTESYFESLLPKEKEEFLKEEIWIKEKFDAWINKRARDRRRQLSQRSGRYRNYIRGLKNEGKQISKFKW